MSNPHVAALNRAESRVSFHSFADECEWWAAKAHEYAALADGLEHSLAAARRRAANAEAAVVGAVRP